MTDCADRIEKEILSHPDPNRRWRPRHFLHLRWGEADEKEYSVSTLTMAMKALCNIRRVTGMQVSSAVLYCVDGSNYMRIGCKAPVVMNAMQRTEAVILAEKDPTFEWTALSAIHHVHDAYGKKYAPNYMEEILKRFTSKYYSEVKGSQQPTLLEKVAPRTYQRIRYRTVEEMPQVSPVMGPVPGRSVANRTKKRPYFSPSVYVPGMADEKGAEAMRRSEERRVRPKSFLDVPEVVTEGDVTVSATDHKQLVGDSGELAFIKARLHGIVVGAEYGDSQADTVKRINALITEPELTKLDRSKVKWGDIQPKPPTNLVKLVKDLNLSKHMEEALLSDLVYLPRSTVSALRNRDLITVTRANIGGPPYIKTRLGDKVTTHLKLAGKTPQGWRHRGAPLEDRKEK